MQTLGAKQAALAVCNGKPWRVGASRRFSPTSSPAGAPYIFRRFAATVLGRERGASIRPPATFPSREDTATGQSKPKAAAGPPLPAYRGRKRRWESYCKAPLWEERDVSSSAPLPEGGAERRLKLLGSRSNAKNPTFPSRGNGAPDEVPLFKWAWENRNSRDDGKMVEEAIGLFLKKIAMPSESKMHPGETNI